MQKVKAEAQVICVVQTNRDGRVVKSLGTRVADGRYDAGPCRAQCASSIPGAIQHAPPTRRRGHRCYAL